MIIDGARGGKRPITPDDVEKALARDWPALRFRLERWPPQSGRAGTEGGLRELWAAPDPPPDIYLLSLSIPRKHNAPVRALTWGYVTPWKLSLFRTDDTADSWGDERWEKLLKEISRRGG